MNAPALRLWTGKTVHQRYSPFERRFSYDIFLIDLNIGQLEKAGRQAALFSVGGPALFSFRPEDHGPMKKGADLRNWAEALYSSANIDLSGGPIRLVTFARHLLYKFAPLSLWYGYGPDGDLRGIIYEVHNTFGETHCYVAPANSPLSQHEAQKSFHVSPFMDVSGRYRFTLQTLEKKLLVTVENWDAGARTHMANIAVQEVPANSLSLLRLAFVQPLSSIGIMIGIHWQALKIWSRGAGYRRKPPEPVQPATIATPLHAAAENFDE